jgi:hypothetical protein
MSLPDRRRLVLSQNVWLDNNSLSAELKQKYTDDLRDYLYLGGRTLAEIPEKELPMHLGLHPVLDAKIVNLLSPKGAQ